MTELQGSETHENLKRAFARESQANRRYLYFAKRADIDGYVDVATLFAQTAEAETGHAHRLLDFLKALGDPVTNEPIGDTQTNLKSAIAGETERSETVYPDMAKVARAEGFEEIAEWFETLARAEESHARRFTKALETLSKES